MDDAELVRCARGGEVSALGALLERHRARLHAVAVSMLGHGPDAEDAVQDTMLIALRRIGELRDPAAAGGWLLAVLVNECRGQLRRTRRELPVEEPAARGDPLDTVQQSLERAVLHDWVWTALERLPEPQRVAVMLRHFSSASGYETISELCGVPVGTVRSRLSAARARLTDELLATAGEAFVDRDALREPARAAGAALDTYQRTGDVAALAGAFTDDVGFRLFDRVERHGRDLLATLLARDFTDGVVAIPRRVIPGREVSVLELVLENPADQPLHCPPAVTQLHFHAAGRTHRLVSHYAPRPGSSRRTVPGARAGSLRGAP